MYFEPIPISDLIVQSENTFIDPEKVESNIQQTIEEHIAKYYTRLWKKDAPIKCFFE